jgi:phenylpyruvate tautomerase PptA (4-oxalocrotonate tautomerase family)
MPNYRCIVPKDSVPFEKRQEIAVAFTDIHCGSTGAPHNFVNVVFEERADGTPSPYSTEYYMDGGNRAGRPEEVKQKLLGDLLQAFCEITGVPRESISGRITESPASWAMEGGAVLPEPGQEGAEWYAHATGD